MSAKRRLLLVLIPLVFIGLLAAAAEIYLRLQHDAFREANKQVEQTFRNAEIPGLIYERIPHTAETNNHGFRGEDYQLQKPKDVWRVVVVGDSVAQGHGVDMSESLGKRLEHFLNHQRRPDAPEAQVYVVAETGYNTAQELLLLEHKALAYDPDLILWVYCLNDPGHALFHNESNLYSRYFHEPASYAFHGLKRLLFKARERIQAMGEDQEYHRLLHSIYRSQVRGHIEKLAQVTRQADVPVLLLIVPVLETWKLEAAPEYVITPMDYSLLDVHTLVARWALQNGLGVVEGLDAYMGKRLADLILEDWDMWHPNAVGHEDLALQVQKHMLRHGPYPEK